MGLMQFNARRSSSRQTLFGLSLCSFDPAFVDIAAAFGFHVIWIELEHVSFTFREVETLCRIIANAGMLSLVRLPGGQREVVLQAAETGADMLMLPMASEPRDLHSFVRHARYSPAGDRGFYKHSRAMRYCLGETVLELRRQANENLLLWVQVETPAALENLREFGSVEGIDGLFAGPGDLSSVFGVPGNISDPRVTDAVSKCIACTHENGKIAGTAGAAADVRKWLNQQADLLIVGNNLSFYASAAENLRNQLDRVLRETEAPITVG